MRVCAGLGVRGAMRVSFAKRSILRSVLKHHASQHICCLKPIIIDRAPVCACGGWCGWVREGRCVCAGLRGAQTSKEVVPSSMAINRSLRGILRMKIINIAPRAGGVCSAVAGGGGGVPTNR